MSALRQRILVIDDEPQIHRFLGPALDAAGYEPLRADGGQEGLRGIALWSPDAVVLDLGLPDMDGGDVLLRAREFYDGPILILSARDREAEKIKALDNGANDYLEKPFGVGELLARLRAALRQRVSAQAPPGPIRSGAVEIDIEKRRVTRGGEIVKLSPKEYDLLVRLALGHGKLLTHKDLLVAVWGSAHSTDTQYLRVFVGQLRQKL
ncbi:DNA-binding response regulator, partial [Pseudomonas sp. HMWF010]